MVLEELNGKFKSVKDSVKVRFELQNKDKVYEIYFRNENDSLVSKHDAFLNKIDSDYFVNFKYEDRCIKLTEVFSAYIL